jgi:hypothetical protein
VARRKRNVTNVCSLVNLVSYTRASGPITVPELTFVLDWMLQMVEVRDLFFSLFLS